MHWYSGFVVYSMLCFVCRLLTCLIEHDVCLGIFIINLQYCILPHYVLEIKTRGIYYSLADASRFNKMAFYMLLNGVCKIFY